MTQNKESWGEKWEGKFGDFYFDKDVTDWGDKGVRIIASGDIAEFISQTVQQAIQKERERLVEMIEKTDVEMSVNGDVSEDEKAMAKFIYKAHIRHLIKKLKDDSTPSIKTDSATQG